MSKANELQFGGSHYKDMAIEPWDFITANKLPFLEGCIIKYVARWKVKGGMEDLRKARHFLDKLIETEEPKPQEKPVVSEINSNRKQAHRENYLDDN